MKKTNYLTQGAIIAALYAVLTIAFAPISYGNIQVRIAEALTILPFFTPAAIPGLFVGCIIANIYGGNGMIDIVFGSLATLTAAYLSYKMPRKWLVPLPPIVINAIVVGFILNYLFQYPLLITMGWVAVGQIIACYGIGYILLLTLEKYRDKIFK
ncbi:QueT transporter family protein [Alkaliphilus serpentinus]|uniref:QueT transporter family protein n=1 Tax=Alkaliphilus serpentinus TaxID=1482731 RepID=A0A833HMX4_9FIRM|nr:QueT transporter family protein [Alkaliphilus serpentinus]KAB3528945.1 QueT transporter family protein [Alkaliphilus serpentinus]